jgi:pimeloyl-ACP methyl ester carboxylesterase
MDVQQGIQRRGREAILFFLTIGTAIGMTGVPGARCAENSATHEEIKLKLEGGAEHKAAFFSAEKKQAVVFLHQSSATRASWYFMAERLQQLGIASLSLENSTPQDVWSAVDFLRGQGLENIALVGASIGGGAVLQALRQRQDGSINKVILLAPADAPPVESKKIEKLLIVSKQDFFGSATYRLFPDCSPPKMLKEYEGSEHAQDLFNGKYRDDLITLMLGFIQR